MEKDKSNQNIITRRYSKYKSFTNHLLYKKQQQRKQSNSHKYLRNKQVRD